MLPQILMNGVVSGCLVALMALGFALIYNTTRIFHIAHGAVFVAASYLLYFLVAQANWGLSISIVVTLLAALAFGLIIEMLVYAPLYRRRASALVSLLSSIGLYLIVVNVIAAVFGSDTKQVQTSVETSYQCGSLSMTRIQLGQFAISVLVIALALALLRYSGFGRIIRATRDNPVLVSTTGTNLRGVRLAVFSIGSCLAGLSAVLSVLDVGIDPSVGMSAMLAGAVALIVGGVGTFSGPVVGSILLGVLQGVLAWRSSARWTETYMFGLLLLFLLFRPWGLLGNSKRVEETAS